MKTDFLGGKARLISNSPHVDQRGALLPFSFDQLPFVPCRCFAVTGVPAGTVRGGHAHSSGMQLLVCLHGRIAVTLRCENQDATLILEPSGPGLMCGPGVWCQQRYVTDGSVLLVFASEPYDPDSYIDLARGGMMRIAILGSGIMGSSTALYSARRGDDVSLFDAAAVPFFGASRWNEGKIHLGFLYSADPSLQTMHRLLPGGLAFKPLLEDLIGCSIDSVITPTDDIYLCHRHSVVAPDAMHHYLRQVADLVRQQPDARRYLVDVADCRAEKLTPSQLAALSASPDIIAGFRVPERSVATTWIADRFVAALAAAPRIELRMNSRVMAVRPRTVGQIDGQWFVETSDATIGPFDRIVNSLWEGRMAVDLTAGIKPAGKWSNRYRLALFVRTTEPVDVPSAVLAVGPYGDIKNYNGREFYLSWYPAGLRVDSSAVSPPMPPQLDATSERELCDSMLETLAAFLPGVDRIRNRIERMKLAGGWVFAAGQGLLSDPKSTLHRRTDFGITRRGSYLSVDTGKYSTAPWLARKIVESFGY